MLLLALTLTVPGSAQSDPWQPLEVGRSWEYRGVGGKHQVEQITGTRVLRGRTVAVKAYSEGDDAGLENYWTVGVDGTVFLCGFNNQSFVPFAVAYEPPIAYLPGPPALGASRTTDVTAYNVSDGSVFATFTIHFSIQEEVDLVLPAGTFHALGTGQGLPAPRGLQSGSRAFSLDGRVLSPALPGATSNATDWYSDGVGIVQYFSSDLFQLVSLGPPTSIAHSSWGAIKRLYH